MHKAIIKTKQGDKEIYFSYSRHSDAVGVTAFCTGDNGFEATYVRDENIKEIIRDPSMNSFMDN